MPDAAKPPAPGNAGALAGPKPCPTHPSLAAGLKPCPTYDVVVCERCGGANVYRMHAVWRCADCGYKTDCCGW